MSQARRIMLDTETTGLDPKAGHRILEIGCVELLGRKPTGNTLHYYINPDRHVSDEVIAVHGLTNEFLADKPKFSQVVRPFIEFIQGAELVIHNAAFDIGFLDHELSLLAKPPCHKLGDICQITDTLSIARKRHPGQRNSLDALCKRYDIDNRHRQLHGALLDAELLADVYLALTGGQLTMLLDGNELSQSEQKQMDSRLPTSKRSPSAVWNIPVVLPTTEELSLHEQYFT